MSKNRHPTFIKGTEDIPISLELQTVSNWQEIVRNLLDCK